MRDTHTQTHVINHMISYRKITNMFAITTSFFIFSDVLMVQVYPSATNYIATISFCPAHVGKSDLMPPLKKVMQKKDPQGVWVFRNLGSIRDSMTKNPEAPGPFWYRYSTYSHQNTHKSV